MIEFDVHKAEEQIVKRPKRALSRFMRILGPGLVTGAADDDPSGIATYTQTGAQFGYGQLWTVLFMYPLMTAIQEAVARIGAVTGKGLAMVVKENYNRKVLYAVVLLVVTANTINIGADISAMAESTRLILPLPFVLIALVYVAVILLAVVLVPYKTYVKVLKWLAITLLAYPITAIIVTQPWGEVIKATFTPHIEFTSSFLFIITGVLGTTISPYLFFWQTSEVVEEEIAEHRLAQGGGVPRISHHFLRKLRIDTAVGMLASQIVTWFILITGASVLHANGVNNVGTAADAARALEPLVKNFANAGLIAKIIFAVGVVGLGLLAIPVLAGSAAYALSEVFDWKEGLYRKFSAARGFYEVIIVATLLGLLVGFSGINPIKALIFTAVFNGVAAVPLVFLIARIARNEKVMGQYKSGKLSNFLVWTTFVAMAGAAIGMFATLAH